MSRPFQDTGVTGADAPTEGPRGLDSTPRVARAIAEALAEESLNAVAVVRPDGRVLAANSPFRALVGTDDAASRDLSALVAAAEPERAGALLDEAVLYGHTASTLALDHHRPHERVPVRFERVDTDAGPLTLLVAETATAPEHMVETHARRHDAKVASALLATARASAKAHTPVELCRLAAQAFFDVYPAPIVVIHILDRNKEELRLVAAEGEARPWLQRSWRLPLAPESPSPLVQAALQNRTLVLDRVDMVSRFKEFEPFPEGEVKPEEVMATFARLGIRTVADAPITYEGRVLGVIGMGSERETVNESAVHLLELLAHEIAAGLHRLELEATRTRLLEVTRAAHAELAEFTYNLSHDLSEDMRRVATFTHALSTDYGGALPPDGRDLAERVLDSATRLQRRVRGSLELAEILRAEPAEARDMDLDALVRATMRRIARGLGVDASHLRVEGRLPHVRCDPDALPVILDNLIANAVRFNPSPESEVRVSAVEHGEHVDVFVDDNGPGIPRDLRAHVVQPFRKLPVHESSPGAGMGLAVAAKLAERQGGELLIEDPPDAPGTRVRVRLPAVMTGDGAQ